MSEHKILVSCPLIQDSIDEYADEFAAHGVEYDVPDVDQHLGEEKLLKIIDQYDGVIAGDDEFTAAAFNEADRLEAIVKWGIGTDSIDFEAAERNGVAVRNTPGAFAPEVADIAIGYAITLTRHLHVIDREVRRGNWVCPRGVSLAGKTFGVVGVGNIGEETVRRAHAHGMEVIGHDVVPIDEELKAETGLTSVGTDELFKRADIVSLHCPLTPETERMIGEDALAALGPDGYLINTARGRLVDQEALVDALASDRLAGAALDVFDEEPLPPSSPLTEMDDVVLGSHNAQNTVEAVEAVNDRAVADLLDLLTP